MKDNSDFVLTINECRAISSAEIKLSDVTVLAGVNASGKSTIARLFRDIIETSVEYERLLAVSLWEDHFDMIYDTFKILRIEPSDNLLPRNYSIPTSLKKGDISFENAVEGLRNLFNEIVSSKHKAKDRIIDSLCRWWDVDKKCKDDIVGFFETKAKNALNEYKKRLENRDDRIMPRVVSSDAIFKSNEIAFLEKNHLIYSIKKRKSSGKIERLIGLKRAIYIESPFKSIPHVANENVLLMGERNSFYRTKKSSVLNKDINANLFSVLSGDIKRDSKQNESLNVFRWFHVSPHTASGWEYRRSDGEKYPLSSCATGIQALSILNILYTNGWLDSETLLIIDEPEAHLHPQWIVEYAKILLWLNRNLRVRLLLATHSPDMVNSLSTIGESLGMSSTMNFYLAEGDKEKYKFKYRDLGTKVGAIFKAFNKSFKTINDYAEKGL